MSNDIYVKLARKLSHVDKAVRDSGLENVRSYLQKRSLPHDEMMLVWKALFYCHWHSDKPLVQQELARSLAGLMADFGFKDVLMFWSCFYETMGREWQGIDRLRLDKFYDLCRCMSQGMFARLQQQGWNAVVVEPFVLALEEHVFRNAALAVTLHFIDYLVSDLVEANCPCPAVILQPVLGLFATCPNKLVLKRILENVIGKASSIPNLDLESMGKRCFALGAFPETAQKNRKFLYAASKELGGGVGDSGLYDQQEQTLQQEERDAKFEKANAKRKRIKIAKGASIESVLPHVPTRPVMEQDKGEAAPNINEESSVSNPLEKAKQKLKKKKREQKQRISFSDQEEGKDERPASQPEEAKKVLRKREPEASANDADLLVVAAKKAKPAPSDVISAPSPPKMILNALSTSLKKSPSSAGKSVVFALDKNTTHTFKRDQPEKRRFSWF